MSDPIPPTPVKASLLTAGKIFLVVTVFLAMQEGTQALMLRTAYLCSA